MYAYCFRKCAFSWMFSVNREQLEHKYWHFILLIAIVDYLQVLAVHAAEPNRCC